MLASEPDWTCDCSSAGARLDEGCYTGVIFRLCEPWRPQRQLWSTPQWSGLGSSRGALALSFALAVAAKVRRG
jgi:hypothetical protein